MELFQHHRIMKFSIFTIYFAILLKFSENSCCFDFLQIQVPEILLLGLMIGSSKIFKGNELASTVFIAKFTTILR